MNLKQFTSEQLCEELNHRYGRIERESVLELADCTTEKLVAELIDRSDMKSGIQVMKVTGDDVFDPRIHSNGKEYGFTLEAPAFFISFKSNV